jgi:hypothetical protein
VSTDVRGLAEGAGASAWVPGTGDVGHVVTAVSG